jgi:four helix bundle protein
VQNFKNLQVWQTAHQLTLGVYQATTGFPSDERYGLTSQIRQACASILANIAEGTGRDSDGELSRFLLI